MQAKRVLIFNRETQCFILVKQFRPPVYVHHLQQGQTDLTAADGQTIEVCAGIVDKNMSYADHVVAEVEEETGYRKGTSHDAPIIRNRERVGG